MSRTTITSDSRAPRPKLRPRMKVKVSLLGISVCAIKPRWVIYTGLRMTPKTHAVVYRCWFQVAKPPLWENLEGHINIPAVQYTHISMIIPVITT